MKRIPILSWLADAYWNYRMREDMSAGGYNPGGDELFAIGCLAVCWGVPVLIYWIFFS